LTSCLTGLDSSVLQMKTKVVSCHTADSKPVQQEDNSTAIRLPLVFPGKNVVFFYFLLNHEAKKPFKLKMIPLVTSREAKNMLNVTFKPFMLSVVMLNVVCRVLLC
jgi:hypothetical protein